MSFERKVITLFNTKDLREIGKWLQSNYHLYYQTPNDEE